MYVNLKNSLFHFHEDGQFFFKNGHIQQSLAAQFDMN